MVKEINKVCGVGAQRPRRALPTKKNQKLLAPTSSLKTELNM